MAAAAGGGGGGGNGGGGGGGGGNNIRQFKIGDIVEFKEFPEQYYKVWKVNGNKVGVQVICNEGDRLCDDGDNFGRDFSDSLIQHPFTHQLIVSRKVRAMESNDWAMFNPAVHEKHTNRIKYDIELLDYLRWKYLMTPQERDGMNLEAWKDNLEKRKVKQKGGAKKKSSTRRRRTMKRRTVKHRK